MSRFVDAVSWSDQGAVFSLFTVFGAAAPPGVLKQARSWASSPTVCVYHLEDLDKRLGDRQCYEYDLVFDAVPLDIEVHAKSWLRTALEAGAEIAWFAFEGSFDFNHILTADVARQVFGVGDGAGIELAVEDQVRASGDWVARILEVRKRAGL